MRKFLKKLCKFVRTRTEEKGLSYVNNGSIYSYVTIISQRSALANNEELNKGFFKNISKSLLRYEYDLVWSHLND